MTYQKRFEIIKKLIDKTFPDNVEEYHYIPYSKDFLIMIKCLDGNCVVESFEIDSNWEHLKKYIERKIKYPMSSDYSVRLICYELITIQEILCRICRFIQCKDCFYNILRQNRGIHICPKCRYTFDRRSGKIDDNTLTLYCESDSHSDYDSDSS